MICHEWEPNPGVSDERREARVRLWVNSFESLRGQTSGEARQKVEDILSFVSAQVITGIPVVDNKSEYCGVHHLGDEGSVSLVPLFESDAGLHHVFKALLEHGCFSYTHTLRSVILQPQMLSSIWRGIVLSHELSHGKNAFHGSYEGRDHLEEQSVYADQFQIMEQVLGESYIKHREKYAKKVAKEVEVDGITKCGLLGYADNVVGDSLGRPIYRGEDAWHRGSVALDIGFTALRLLERDTAEMLADLVTWYCSD